MTWEFKVGQGVVCVDDVRTQLINDSGWALKKGGLYTIRWVGVHTHPVLRETNICVRLEELDRSYTRPEPDLPFLASRFRPLITDTQFWLKEVLENPPENVSDLERVGAGGLR